MLLTFGKHFGRLLEAVVLKEPAYVRLMLSYEGANGPLARAQEEALRLIEIFDARPFLLPCTNPDCHRTATCCWLFYYSFSPKWWCGKCDLPQTLPCPDLLYLFGTYGAAASYIETAYYPREEGMRRLIRLMAEAKGLPEGFTDRAAEEFFAPRPPAPSPAD
jgi:hypothetical protein